MENIIDKTTTILEALKKINGLSKGSALTLFIVDEDKRLCGTLTDGDLRRCLTNGFTLEALAIDAAQKNFKYIKESNYSIEELHNAKERCVFLLPIVNDQMQIVDVINLKRQKSLLPVDAVLMAGGKGVRLRPLTETTPKPLLPVGDKPIIDYNIDSLLKNGIKHISVTVNYLHEQLEKHFAEPVNGIKVDCIREPQFLGTMGATQFVPKFYNDVVLVMNSDLFTNIDYEDFYLHFKEHDADMSVAAVPYSVSVPYGIFDLDGRNIRGVKEKPVYNYFANAGIYLIKRELLENMPKNTFYNATDLMNDAVVTGKTVIRYPITGYWLDIGSHEEYNKANELVKHIKKSKNYLLIQHNVKSNNI